LLCKYKRNEAHFVSLLTEKEKKKEKTEITSTDAHARARLYFLSLWRYPASTVLLDFLSFFSLPPLKTKEKQREREREQRNQKLEASGFFSSLFHPHPLSLAICFTHLHSNTNKSHSHSHQIPDFLNVFAILLLRSERKLGFQAIKASVIHSEISYSLTQNVAFYLICVYCTFLCSLFFFQFPCNFNSFLLFF